MRFNVTAKDIREGIADNCIKCPVARAIQRKFPNHTIYAAPWSIFIDNKSYYIPKSAYSFILKFDKKQDVKPFSFEIKEL